MDVSMIFAVDLSLTQHHHFQATSNYLIRNRVNAGVKVSSRKCVPVSSACDIRTAMHTIDPSLCQWHIVTTTKCNLLAKISEKYRAG